MKTVQRNEIVDYQTYNERRDEIRRRAMELKDARRVHVGEYVTFLFENHETVRYQIQEMMRVEQLVKEADIQHEIETYNELLGDKGELGCTLLIEIDDVARRQSLLRQWLELPKHVYLKTENGKKVYPRFDPRQVGENRLSSVQYLKFDTEGEVPVAVGSDLRELQGETPLDAAQRQALAEDLAS